MSKEAMKLALEKIADALPTYIDGVASREYLATIHKALTEQPAQQEPWCMKMNGCKTKCEDCPVEVQPAQQEPVLQEIEQYRLQMAGICTAAIGYWKEGDGIHPDYDTIALRDVAKLYAKYDELYRAQRTWVGLTDEEISDIAINNSPIVHEFARAIEAKLKEKNT